MLSNRKSLWISTWATSSGWCSLDPLDDVGPVAGVVGARLGEPADPAADLAADVTVVPCRAWPASGSDAVSTECSATRTSKAFSHRRGGVLGSQRRRAARGAGSCRRASPSRRTPSRSPTRRRSGRPSWRRTGTPARAPTGSGTRGPCRGRWPPSPRPAGGAGSGRRSGVPEQVGQVGGAARELAHLGRADQVVAERRRVVAQPGRHRLDVEGVLVADRRRPGCRRRSRHRLQLRACARITASYAGRSCLLQRPGVPGRLVGHDQLVAAVDARPAPRRRCRRR